MEYMRQTMVMKNSRSLHRCAITIVLFTAYEMFLCKYALSVVNEGIYEKQPKFHLDEFWHSLDQINQIEQKKPSERLATAVRNVCVCLCNKQQRYWIMTTSPNAQLAQWFNISWIRPYGCAIQHNPNTTNLYTWNCPYRTVSRIWMFNVVVPVCEQEFNFPP